MEACLCTCLAQASNLEDYSKAKKEKNFEFPDLNQLCRNKRGRGETKDGALQTLTTNSGRIFSKAISMFAMFHWFKLIQ